METAIQDSTFGKISFKSFSTATNNKISIFDSFADEAMNFLSDPLGSIVTKNLDQLKADRNFISYVNICDSTIILAKQNP